jgi:hypothetical protein
VKRNTVWALAQVQGTDPIWSLGFRRLQVRVRPPPFSARFGQSPFLRRRTCVRAGLRKVDRQGSEERRSGRRGARCAASTASATPHFCGGRYGGGEVPDACRLRALKDENRRLKTRRSRWWTHRRSRDARKTLLAPSLRKHVVTWRSERRMIERACGLVGLHPKTYRSASTRPDDSALRIKLKRTGVASPPVRRSPSRPAAEFAACPGQSRTGTDSPYERGQFGSRSYWMLLDCPGTDTAFASTPRKSAPS